MKKRTKRIIIAAMCAMLIAAVWMGTTTAFLTDSKTLVNHINVMSDGSVSALLLEPDWDGVVDYVINDTDDEVYPVYAYIRGSDGKSIPVFGYQNGDYSKPVTNAEDQYAGQKANYDSTDPTRKFLYGEESARNMTPGRSAAKNPYIKNTSVSTTEWAAVKITFVYASGDNKGQPLTVNDMQTVCDLVAIDYNCDDSVETNRHWKRIDETPDDETNVLSSDVSQVFYCKNKIAAGENTEPVFTRVRMKETASAEDAALLKKMGGFAVFVEGCVVQVSGSDETFDEFEDYGINGGVVFKNTPTSEKPADF